MGQIYGKESFGDMSEVFRFLEKDLVYVDAPISGFVQAALDGSVFAFQCVTIIDDRLWHWTLLPVADLSETCDSVFSKAIRSPPATWLSVVEDRRTSEPRLSAVWIHDGRSLPVRDPETYGH